MSFLEDLFEGRNRGYRGGHDGHDGDHHDGHDREPEHRPRYGPSAGGAGDGLRAVPRAGGHAAGLSVLSLLRRVARRDVRVRRLRGRARDGRGVLRDVRSEGLARSPSGAACGDRRGSADPGGSRAPGLESGSTRREIPAGVQVMKECDPATARGLSEAEAARRLCDEGANEIPSAQNRGLWAIGWEVVREPMFLMLVAAGALYLSMGDLADALMLLGFRVLRHGDHRRPGTADRAGARRASRPVEPPRPGRPRRRAAANRRPRGRAGRPRRRLRGRPSAGGRAAATRAGTSRRTSRC